MKDDDVRPVVVAADHDVERCDDDDDDDEEIERRKTTKAYSGVCLCLSVCVC